MRGCVLKSPGELTAYITAQLGGGLAIRRGSREKLKCTPHSVCPLALTPWAAEGEWLPKAPNHLLPRQEVRQRSWGAEAAHVVVQEARGPEHLLKG